MTRHYGVDLMRFIGAFAVLLVHTNYANIDDNISSKIGLSARWAVPFFFMTTGFFLGKKIDDNGSLGLHRLEKNLVQLISILLVSSFIYAMVNVYYGWVTYQVGNVIVGTYFHLWFIGALIFGYILIWYILALGKQKLLPIISIGILLMALLADSYDIIIGESVNFDLYRFLLAIPFMYAGIRISNSNFKYPGKGILLIIAAVGMGVQIGEATFLNQFFGYSLTVHQFLLGTIIMTIPIFLFGLKLNVRKSIFSEWGRKYSLFIYLYHPLIFFIFNIALIQILPDHFDEIQILYPIVGFLLALSLAIGLDRYTPRIFQILNGNIYRQ